MSCKSLLLILILCVVLCSFTLHASPQWSDGHDDVKSLLVRKNERLSLLSNEYGEISAVHIGDGERGSGYYLQFITLEPDTLFLPVLLRMDMVFFVHSGAGRLSWADEDGRKQVKLKRGDVFSLRLGSIFFVQSNLETDRQKLRIYAIFTNSQDHLHEPAMEAYTSIRDLVLGFDMEVLRAAFQVPKEMIDELISRIRQPAIVHASTTETKEKSLWDIDSQYLEVILGRGRNMFEVNKKKSETKTFNLFDQKPDFKNCYGQSLIVNKNNLHSLKRPNLSVFLVNLTTGSMMGPHWNPMASEVSIVLQGEGMVTVVGPRTKSDSETHQSTRFRVGDGDVFVVPRLHPMAQIAFNNNSFVFMGFSSSTKKNHPQYLAGKASVLRTLEKRIVATSFGATNMSAFDHFMDQQGESVILKCVSCAEEEFRRVEEEMKRQREKEEKRRREEEERKREEEEQKRREEEEAKRREEEAETARREEEERKQREEEARRQEEKRKRQEEEERRRREEEEAKTREEEARRRREEKARREEEEARRQEEERTQREEEEARAREEEERQKREQEQEEEDRRRKEEQAREQEKAMRRREEEARREEEERRQREEEEASASEEEERQKREQEQEQEEERRRKEEQAREQEEAMRQREEEARREEEERRQREEEEASAREEEERQRREEEEEAMRKEGERARRQEEEEEKGREEKSEEEEEATRREEEEAKMREAAMRERREEAARREEEEARGQEEKAERIEEETQEREEGGGGDDERRRVSPRVWKFSDF